MDIAHDEEFVLFPHLCFVENDFCFHELLQCRSVVVAGIEALLMERVEREFALPLFRRTSSIITFDAT